MAKTYLPEAVEIAKRLCFYLIRYGATIKLFLPESKHVYVDALVQACTDFTAAVEPEIPTGV